MSRYDPASPYFRRELRLRLTALTIAALSLLVLPFDGKDRVALLVALIATTVFRLRTVRRRGPRDASDYLVLACIGLAVTGMAVALALAHLTDDRGWAPEIYGCMAMASAVVTAWNSRLALLVKRLPGLLGPEEELRAFAVGTAEVDGRKKRVAVMVSDRRLIVAAPHGGRPRLVAGRSLARVDAVDVHATDPVAEIQIRADGKTLDVRRVPIGQALDLAAALGSKTG